MGEGSNILKRRQICTLIELSIYGLIINVYSPTSKISSSYSSHRRRRRLHRHHSHLRRRHHRRIQAPCH